MSRRMMFVMVMVMLVGAGLVARTARAAMPSDAVMDSLLTLAQDTTRSEQGVAGLRRVMLDVPSDQRPLLRHLVTLGLLTQRAPTPELLACADSMLADTALGAYMRANYSTLISRELLNRKERQGWADSAAHAALTIAHSSPQGDLALPVAAALMARLLLARDQADSVVVLLEPIVAASPRVAGTNWYLARGYERVGRLDDAIATYVGYESSGWADTTISSGLRAVYAKRHGGLEGLDTLMAGARARARHRETFVIPRVDRPAPAWTLPTLEGRRRSSRELAGRVTVLEFWGTWCAGCIENMPRFIELMRDPRWKDVAFQTVNCEFAEEGVDVRRRVTDLVREKGWNIPVVQDSARRVSDAFGVAAYPTTVLIDRAGRMRFRNAGLDPGGVVLRDQLTLLLSEEKAGRRK